MSKPREDHFEEFQGHTLLKHLILDKYLKAWANKLLQWGAAGSRVWFVDAFAGEGADKKGNPGSPLIAAKMARDVVQTLRRSGRPSDADIRIIAIEKDTSRFGILKSLMEPYAAGADPIARLHHGTLAEIIDDLMTEVGEEPALFFLDPFGVEGLLSELLPPALSGPHNEIFALFSDIGAVRLHAALNAPERDADREIAEALTQRNLFVEEDVRIEEERKGEVAKSVAALHATRPAAQRILTEALGPDRVKQLDDVPVEFRYAKAVQIYMRLLVESGSRFVLPLRVRDELGNPKYYLIHASKSPSGFQTMKEAISSAFAKSPLPDRVLRRISLDTATPIGPVVEQIQFYFAGQHVRWTEGKNRTPGTVRGYALRHTPIFPAQMPGLQVALKERGFIKTARPVTYAFPG